MSATAFINWRLKKDFAAEFIDSLKPKDPAPLGESEVKE
jgi:hypothetical protein